MSCRDELASGDKTVGNCGGDGVADGLAGEVKAVTQWDREDSRASWNGCGRCTWRTGGLPGHTGASGDGDGFVQVQWPRAFRAGRGAILLAR